jgi:hypothetical protein
VSRPFINNTFHSFINAFPVRELISIEKCSPTKPKPRRGFILVLVFVRDMRDTRDFRDMTILFTKIKKIIVKNLVKIQM